MTTGNGRRSLLLVAAVVAALGLVFTGARADDGVMFGYQFAEGATHDYKVKFTQEMDYGGFASSQFMDFEVTEKCVGTTEDGKFKMELVFNKAESSRMQFENMVEDQSFESLVGQSVSYLVDGHGAVSDIKALGYVENWMVVSQNIIMMMQFWYAHLPREQVVEGDGWEQSADKVDNGAGMLVSTNAEFSFEETKEHKGHECAKVKAEVELKLEGGMGGAETTGDGTGDYEFYFDPDGSVIVMLKSKIEIKLEVAQGSGQGDVQEIVINIQMDRELL